MLVFCHTVVCFFRKTKHFASSSGAFNLTKCVSMVVQKSHLIYNSDYRKLSFEINVIRSNVGNMGMISYAL